MNPLQSRLADLRRRLRLVVTFRGGCWAFAALVGSLALACLIDQAVYLRLHRDLPGAIRAFFLVGILAGTAFVTYRLLLRPMTARTDDLSLALRVEEEYPILNDALASTVEFLHQAKEASPGTSATMQREAVQRAMRLAQGCDFNKAVDTRGTRLAFLCMLASCGLVLPLLLWSPSLATSLVRVADPLGGHLWPGDRQQTFLEVEYAPRIGFGQKFTIHGKVTGVLPEKATIEFDGLAPSPQIFKIVQKEVGVLTAPIDMTQQRRNFKFKVRAGDAVSPPEPSAWHSVELRHPPSLVPLHGKSSPQVELTYPKYTDLKSPEKLSPGTGNIEGVAGTFVRLRGATDRPITRVWVEYRPVVEKVTEASCLTVLGALHPVDALALAAGGHAVWGKVPGAIRPGGKEFALDFLPWTQGTYLLVVEDAEGLTKAYEFDQKIIPDPVPTVAFERPSGSQNVLPDAAITVRVFAEDEVYAVRNVYLEYRVKGKDGEFLDDGPRRVPLYDHEAVGVALPQVLAAFVGAPFPVAGPPLRLRQKQVQTGTRWALGGLGLKVGDTVVVQACAHDFNDVVAFNVGGRSPAIELRVVARPALIANIDDAQARMEQELMRLREKQGQAIKKVINAEQQWRTTGKLRPEDAVEIAEAEQLQKQIQERIGQKQEEGLRGELSRLQQTMRDNKLPASATAERLKMMKEELDRLAREHLPQIEPRLTNARRELEGKQKARPPAPKTKGDLGRARAHQEEVKQTLEALLKHLENWADVQQLRGELRQILQEQRELQQDTEKLELNTRQTKGELKPEDDAMRRRLAALQTDLAKRTQELIEKMQRVAEERAMKDPRAAEMLEKVAQIGKDAMLPGEIRDTAKQLQPPPVPDPADPTRTKPAEPQFKRAVAQQVETIKTLERMVEAMEEGRDAEVERLLKRQRNEAKNLDDLGEKLERLRKKVKDANNIKDGKERKEALQKLAEEQRELQDQAEKKARELARLQAPRAGKALDQAGKKMERAAKRLDQGEDPEEEQKEALERVKEAQDQLQQAQERAEEELAREQLARYADQLKGLKERQDAAIVESTRLHKSMLQNSRWTRGLVESLGDNAGSQSGLARDTASAKEKLKGAIVFDLILAKTVKAMEGAAKRINERKDQALKHLVEPGPLGKEALAEESLAEKQTQKLQQEASRRLQRLLDAVKQEPNVAQRPKQKQGDPKEKGGEKDKGGKAQKGIPGDGIPALAQLKALRGEQQEVNDRTREFAEQHPNVENLPEPQRAELEALRQDQERLFELFRKMAQAVSGQGGNP